MEIINKKENQIAVSCKLNETLANAIRRYVGEIPTLAIEEVEIAKNNSALYDETISHRIGLIPLKTEKGITEAKLKLKSKKEGFVYSGEMKGDAEVVYSKIPIVFLDNDQELELTAIAKIGKGSEHAKHSPGMIYYRNISEITLDKEFLDEVKMNIPEAKIKEKGNKIIVTDDGAKEIADVCEGIAESKGKKAEIENKDELILTIESFGNMDAKEIFKKSVERITKDLDEVLKKIK